MWIFTSVLVCKLQQVLKVTSFCANTSVHAVCYTSLITSSTTVCRNSVHVWATCCHICCTAKSLLRQHLL